MVTPAEDPQVHGQGPGRVSLSDSSGTGDEKSDSYQVFPDYSQLVVSLQMTGISVRVLTCMAAIE